MVVYHHQAIGHTDLFASGAAIQKKDILLNVGLAFVSSFLAYMLLQLVSMPAGSVRGECMSFSNKGISRRL